MSSQFVQVFSETRLFRANAPADRPNTRLLRVSVTDRCNFRCRYCMPVEGVPAIPHLALLSLEELAEMVRWLSRRMPIERVKLTGGEPLVRLGLGSLIAALVAIPGIREVSLTTNGSLLAEKAWELKASGLARASVSLDSLDHTRFADLTRGGKLDDTLAGIDAALKAGLAPIKLNAVLQRSTWTQDVPELLDFAADRGLEIRFIELMRTGTEREWSEAEFISVDEVKAWVSDHANLSPITTPAGTPAQMSKLQWRDRYVSVGWIAPRTHPFCGSCERVRLDCRGRLRRCLMDSSLLDLVSLRGKGDRSATEAVSRYMAAKFAPNGMDSEYMMSQIGG